MGVLNTAPNVARPDDLYHLLVDAYGGLDEAGLERFHARLALLLINHIGDAGVVGQAIAAALPPATERRHT